MQTQITLLAAATLLSLVVATDAAAQPITHNLIEQTKLSIAPIVCVRTTGSKAQQLNIDGTAFFISEAGEFITAAHVLDDFSPGHELSDCRAAIEFQDGGWGNDRHSYQPFFFDVAKCEIDTAKDVGHCATNVDLTQAADGKYKARPLHFAAAHALADQTLAYSGFPVISFIPITVQVTVSSYSPSQLILDGGTAWPGNSGSPVYNGSGEVVGMILSTAFETGFNNAIPDQAIVAFLKNHPLSSEK